MKKTNYHSIYTDEPIQIGRRVSDFLPPPHELVFKDKKVKVTISLTKRTVNFFKRQAKGQQSQYQKLIRRLLDEYAARHEQVNAVHDE